VHRFVKTWRDERARVPARAYVPMSFAPGEAYQFDWSHETITLQGLPLTVKAAHPAAVLLFLNVKDENVDSKLSNCSNPMT